MSKNLSPWPRSGVHTKVIWFLAAICIMLLGIGVGEYTHLGTPSSNTPTPSSVRAITPPTLAATPRPMGAEESPPYTGPVPRTVPTTSLHAVPPSLGTVPASGARPAHHSAPHSGAAARSVTSAHKGKTAHSGVAARVATAGRRGNAAHSGAAALGGAVARSATSAHKGKTAHSGVAARVATAGRIGNAAHSGAAALGGTAARSEKAVHGTKTVNAPRTPRRAGTLHEKAKLAYVVKPKDTLWDLAATHLGNAYRWSELFNLNRGRPEPGGSLVDPNLIYAGWTLQFPESATGLTLETAPHRQVDSIYVVQPGDTLWDLAAAHLGSPYRWVQLFDLNRGRPEPGGSLVDPNVIYAGWTLEFPTGAIGFSAASASTHSTGSQGLENRTLPVTVTLVAYQALQRLGQQAVHGLSGWSL